MHRRRYAALVVPLVVALASAARAQTPTPTPQLRSATHTPLSGCTYADAVANLPAGGPQYKIVFVQPEPPDVDVCLYTINGVMQPAVPRSDLTPEPTPPPTPPDHQYSFLLTGAEGDAFQLQCCLSPTPLPTNAPANTATPRTPTPQPPSAPHLL